MMPPPAIARAVRMYGRHDVRVDLVPVEGPAPGEVLLRVGAVGLCGSDLHWYEEAGIGDAVLSRPLILGHEIGAEIAAGPRDGQRVAVDPAWDCGRCEPCLRGRSNLCLSMRFAGHGTTDGALRGMMPWPERLVWAVPDSIRDDEIPLLEPLGVAMHALDLAGLKAGDRVGVYGCGPLGLLLVSLLRSRGIETIAATDILAHRVAAARAAGATDAFLVARDAAGPAEAGSASTDSSDRHLARDFAVDVAFEVAGSDDALSDAIAAVEPGGRIVLVGIPAGDRTAFEAAAARRKELAFLECRRMMAADLPRAIDLVAAGSIDLSSLITGRYPISAAREAFASLADRRGLKVIVNPNAE
jgi:L-iditol 2-dehydrogenase